jgi:hypothetical protein
MARYKAIDSSPRFLAVDPETTAAAYAETVMAGDAALAGGGDEVFGSVYGVAVTIQIRVLYSNRAQ